MSAKCTRLGFRMIDHDGLFVSFAVGHSTFRFHLTFWNENPRFVVMNENKYQKKKNNHYPNEKMIHCHNENDSTKFKKIPNHQKIDRSNVKIIPVKDR